jgi:BirA family biotin operon repressor/biotin-[acetyl-CoA-carboxylase] ligase
VSSTLDPDLAPERVTPRLDTRTFGRHYRFLPRCGSTHDEAVTAARAGEPEGLVVVADEQSGGRGRLGRTWHSPPGTSIHLSLLLRPAGSPAAFPPLTLLAGGVMARVLEDEGFAPILKWPNDVLLPTPEGPRKVAGILTEMASDRERIRHVVLGLGLNVNTAAFPPEIASRATSLRLQTGRTFDRGRLVAAFLNALEPACDELSRKGAEAALARFRPYARLGHRCRVDQGGQVVEGIALDVDADGALRLRDDAGKIVRVLSGEIA